MTSRREREKQERQRSANGVPGMKFSCQVLHPVYQTKCWSGKPCKAGERHFVVRPKAGGGFEKHYWRVEE